MQCAMILLQRLLKKRIFYKRDKEDFVNCVVEVFRPNASIPKKEYSKENLQTARKKWLNEGKHCRTNAQSSVGKLESLLTKIA